MKIMIIDDDRLVGISLKTIIEAQENMTVPAAGCSGSEAVSLYDEISPDVLLMDIRMEGISGLEAGEMILKKHPEARILYLTTFADDEYIIKALSIGAKGYILKQDFESIAPSIRAVCAGQSVFGDNIVSRIPKLLSSRNEKEADLVPKLSERESDITSLVAEGLSNRDIAAKLFLSEGTVRNNISVILEKLQLSSRTQLAVFYYKNMR